MSFYDKYRREIVGFLLARDGRFCSWCGKELVSDVTVDHIIPVSRGGTDTLINLRLMHRDCNTARGNVVFSYKKGFREILNPPKDQLAAFFGILCSVLVAVDKGQMKRAKTQHRKAKVIIGNLSCLMEFEE